MVRVQPRTARCSFVHSAYVYLSLYIYIYRYIYIYIYIMDWPPGCQLDGTTRAAYLTFAHLGLRGPAGVLSGFRQASGGIQRFSQL